MLTSRLYLSRCYLPSGKVLWLCKEHQRLPRVTVLQDSTADEEDTSPDDEAESEMTKGDSDFGLLEQDLLAGLKLLLEDKTTKSEVSSTTATGELDKQSDHLFQNILNIYFTLTARGSLLVVKI